MTEQDDFLPGALDDLEKLESRFCKKSREKCEADRTAKQIKPLKQRYSQLVKRRDELKRRLKTDSQHRPLDGDTPGEEMALKLTAVRKRRLQDLVDSYKLTGISATRQDDNVMLIRFDTSHDGQFLEPYYVELVYNNNLLSIRKFTIPAFVPLASLAKKYLEDDLQRFLMTVGEHVQAYVKRREEMRSAQRILTERGYINGEINCSLAVDIVQFRVDKLSAESLSIDVVLRFSNLLHLKPDSVNVTVVGDNDGNFEVSPDWKSVLTSLPLSKSVDQLFPGKTASERGTAGSDSETSESD